MGEELYFNFFESRYRQLVQEAMSTTSSSASKKGWFILRATTNVASCTLMKIIEHTDPFTTNDMVFVKCIAGPRIKVVKEIEVPINNTNTALDDNNKKLPSPMIRATHIAFDKDDKVEEDIVMLNDMRSKCLSLLPQLFPKSLFNDESSIGPPPLDMESFSFWILRYVLGDSREPAPRLEWLACHSTNQRLTFVYTLLKNAVEKRNNEQESEEES